MLFKATEWRSNLTRGDPVGKEAFSGDFSVPFFVHFEGTNIKAIYDTEGAGTVYCTK